jgi:hypothetical protein
MKIYKDNLRRETETHAGYRFTEAQWEVVKTLTATDIVRLGFMFEQTYAAGVIHGRRTQK